MPTKTCLGCGQPFTAKTKRRDYCAGKCFRDNERARSNRHRTKFSPERRRAHILVGCALAKRELIPQPCEICGSRRYVEGHHDDYAKPLNIRWLCKSHHRQHHHKFGPGLNAFCEEISA